MSLDTHVRHLLFDHDLVVIPEFGGFLTKYRPAHIHLPSGTIHPPSRSLSFNHRLHSNDGLLAHEVMRGGYTYEEAMELIQQRVQELKSGLADRKRAELNGVGVIYRDEEGNYRFAPADRLNLLKDSFGLRSIALRPAEKAEDTSAELEPSEATHDFTPVIPIRETPASVEPETGSAPSKQRYLRVAAIILPVAIVASAWLFRDHLPVNAQALGISPADPVITSAEFQPRFEEEDIRFDYPPAEDRIESIAASNPALSSIYFDFSENEMNPEGIRVQLNKRAEAVVAPVKNTPVKTVNARLAHKYFIVGGAFSKESNAHRMVGDLVQKGYDAYIFSERKGLFMVCYGGYEKAAEARKALKKIRAEENSKAWFKRK